MATETTVAQRAMQWSYWARSDNGARWAFRIALLGASVLLYVVGRHQWFIRDDWAFIFTREKLHSALGLDAMLLTPQDGHWMTPPILVYRAIQESFGIGSYWPYLLVLLATHVAAVLLVRELCRRVGASAWTTTLICCVLLVFGTGWENIVFAIQITYNFSLLAFLAHLVLVDHDGPVDRRDGLGVGLSLVGVSSSGFGPFFIVGVGVLLVLRRRWAAAAVAVIPQALLLGWWWITWGADPAGEANDSTIRTTLEFLHNGMLSTFGGFSGLTVLAGSAALAAFAVCFWPRVPPRPRTLMITLWVVALAMYLGIGNQRSGFVTAAASRYQYMAAMLLAPPLALALDQARRFAPWARWLPRVLLVLAIGRNAVLLSDQGGAWAERSGQERRAFGLIDGSGADEILPASNTLLDFSPDVRAGDIDVLVDAGAIESRVPATAEEQAIVDAALDHPQP